MDQPVYASVGYSAECRDCGDETECRGVQALTDGRLRWDVESACSACGSAAAVCGGDLPAELRERILLVHGPATLRIEGPAVDRVTVMRVLRAELGLDLASAKAVLRQVLDGEHSGTRPEMERPARALRRSGVAAVAARLRAEGVRGDQGASAKRASG
ncbi:hypothetical protein ACWC10_34900 [Streptomyces sp. NPDC001595]|uniref:hypothetical protein n=1 Tax=Streptomyces sp. NPDC001532 TaxID=3154520 RepID=UPI0033252BC8